MCAAGWITHRPASLPVGDSMFPGLSQAGSLHREHALNSKMEFGPLLLSVLYIFGTNMSVGTPRQALCFLVGVAIGRIAGAMSGQQNFCLAQSARLEILLERKVKKSSPCHMTQCKESGQIEGRGEY